MPGCLHNSFYAGLSLLFLVLNQCGWQCTGETICSNPKIYAGPSYRWPEENPMLVAPVTAVYKYDAYNAPLPATFVDDMIRIEMPGSYRGGFILTTNVEQPPLNTQDFILKSITIRRPGGAPPGVGQALDHQLEIALVHELINAHDPKADGSYYAVLVLPLLVQTSGTYDVLDELVGGSPLPNSPGSAFTVLDSDNSDLLLDTVLDGAEFLEYWGTLPTSCGKDVPARMMYKLRTYPTTQESVTKVLRALGNGNPPQALVSRAASAAWLIGTCLSGTSCTPLESTDLKPTLNHYLQVQSQSTLEVRDRKRLLDDELSKMMAGQEGGFQMAVSARDDLRTASQELSEIEKAVARLDVEIHQNETMVWNSNTPAPSSIRVPVATINGTVSGGNATIPRLRNTSLIQGAAVDAAIEDTSSENCFYLGISPINIDSSRVVDPSAISSDLAQPLQFRYMSLLQMEGSASDNMMEISNNGHYLHVSSGKDVAQRVGPLGAIVSNNLVQGVSYIDIHTPSQHTVDGKLSPVELHIVHVSARQKPDVAVSVRLEMDNLSNKNEWIGHILDQVSKEYTPQQVHLKPLALLHPVFDEESTTRYFHYDGTLTTPPCRSTQWFVLEEPGHISEQQLLALQRVLPAAGLQPKRFDSSVVLRGSQSTYTEVGLKGRGESSVVSSKRARHGIKLRKTRRVQI